MAHPFLGNALVGAYMASSAAINPPPPPDYLNWAENNIEFGDESPFKGPYNPDLFPFFTPILRALQPDDPTSTVSLLKSAQLGGTVLGSIFMGASMDLDPCPMMNTHPTVDNATRYKKNKWTPFVKGSDALKSVMALGANRDGGDSATQQNRRDERGFIMWNGANSAASLSQHSIKKQVQDDLSKWCADNDEGDPEQQAETRSLAYSGKGAKIFKTSTPTLKGECRITKRFMEGTQEYWEIPCPHCGEYQALMPQDFIDNINREHPEQTHFECKDCGCDIHQRHRSEFNKKGRFVPRNILARNRSFFLWSAYSPLVDWAYVAHRYLQAEGEAEAERAVYNDVFGMAYAIKSETPAWDELKARGDEGHYHAGTIPVGGLLLTAGVDCQIDRVEIQIVAWGSKRRRWVVDYHVEWGNIEDEETQRKLAAYLSRTWPDMFGNRRRLDMMAVDSGNWMTAVYEFVLKQSDKRCIAVKGNPLNGSPPISAANFNLPDGQGNKLKTRRNLWMVGVSNLKHTFYQNVKGTDEERRGYVGLPQGLPDNYYVMLTNESKVLDKNKKTGVTKWIWKKLGDNEAIDNMNYAEAAARRLGWDRKSDEFWDHLSALLERPPEDKQEDLFDPARAVEAKARDGAKIVAGDGNNSNEKPRVKSVAAALPGGS